MGTAYTAIFIIASAAKTGLQGKAFYLGPKSLQNYFLGTNVSTSQTAVRFSNLCSCLEAARP